MTHELDDAICHTYSHGYIDGLLETFSLNECEGWETAEQVFEGGKKCTKKHKLVLDNSPSLCYNTSTDRGKTPERKELKL